MEHSIYKEEKVENTVKRIQKILQNVGIPVNHYVVDIGNDSSLAYANVHIEGYPTLGANGKGTNVENALASAYAEFIERLQNQIKLLGQQYYSPDLFVLGYNELVLNDKNLCNLDVLKSIEYDILDDIEDVNKITKVACAICPFYSVKHKSISNLPLFPIIRFLQGSNGMAAGNTIEEAIVQGFSEIVERYATKRILSEQLAMPDIPDSVYGQSSKIVQIIEYYKKCGYRVHIKDASLNGQIPVVCVIVEDIKNDVLIIKFGSHPSLFVSIERCFTEIAQGFDPSSVDDVKVKYSSWINQLTLEDMQYIDLELLDERFFRLSPLIESSEFFTSFMNKQAKVEFALNAWIDSYKECDNKFLLKWFYNKIKDISNGEIYIRDVSFLGFPAVYIVIPSLSFICTKGKKRFKKYNEIMCIPKLIKDNSPELTLEKLYECVECNRLNSRAWFESKISELPDEYLSLLCSILMNDYEKIENHSRLILHNHRLNNKMNAEGIERVAIIRKYYSFLSKNLDIEQILKSLKTEYSEESIEKAIFFIKNLTFELLKKIIINNQSRVSFDGSELIANIFKRIVEEYKNNLPDQMQLKKVFDSIV